jgi:hypothetical protein
MLLITAQFSSNKKMILTAIFLRVSPFIKQKTSNAPFSYERSTIVRRL